MTISTHKPKEINIFLALIPLIVLLPLLAINVKLFDDTLAGPNQMALLLGAAAAGLVGVWRKVPYDKMFAAAANNLKDTSSAIIILLFIGALAGTWLISGIVPTMIYYGLNILNPTIFLFATAIITSVVSLVTGSSWSTIATMGIALLGIGQALGLPSPVIGGAIISGAYFGDKMSPMSDTTNLAPAMAGTDIITHIKYMTLTTFPSMGIALLIYLIMGFFYSNSSSSVDVSNIQSALKDTFTITPWLILVPLIVIGMIIKKVPALPALFAGTLLGALFAFIFQQDLLAQLMGTHNASFTDSYTMIMNAMVGSTSIETNNVVLDNLLSSSGMAGMLNTIWLIITAMIFGGFMEAIGALRAISSKLLRLGKGFVSLIVATTGTTIFFNLTASDQYLAIVVPGRMYADTFRQRGYAPENLSRTLEDAGTVTSVLIPWNTCGATQASVLGVATLAYAPFAFFNIISPIMTILFAVFDIKIKHIEEPTVEIIAE